MAAGHIEMRKRAEANNKKVGTKNPQKVMDPLDKKEAAAVPQWAMYTLFFVVCGGIFFQMADQIFKFLTNVQQVGTK